MTARIRKWGNSAAVRIPAAVLAEAHIEFDQTVEIREDRGEFELKETPRLMASSISCRRDAWRSGNAPWERPQGQQASVTARTRKVLFMAFSWARPVWQE